MDKVKTTITIFFSMILLCLLLSACPKKAYLIMSFEDFKVEPALKQLVHEKHEYFTADYTLAVLLDRQACGGNLVESVWWADWQKFMLDKKLGFVFVTSKVDSSDVAYALNLESIDAPILVLPHSDKVISNLWTPGESIPLKILIDSTAHIYRGWLSIRVVSESQNLMMSIDTIYNN